MPATTDKQQRFFGAVMGAKKGKPGASGTSCERYEPSRLTSAFLR